MAYSDKKYYDRQCVIIMNDDRGLRNDEIDVFTRLNVPKDVTFSDGRPSLNTIYVAHPAKKGFYIPLSDHEEIMFRDKMDELVMLLQALGATEIEIVKTEGMSMEQMNKQESNIGGSASWKSSVSASAEYSSSHSNASSNTKRNGYHLKIKSNSERFPFVPSGMNWFSITPEWEKMVKQRLLGMEEYELELRSSYASSISSSKFESLKASAKIIFFKADLSISSSIENNFKSSGEIVWGLRIKFRPLKEYSQENTSSYSHSTTSNPRNSSKLNGKTGYKESCKQLIPPNGKISDVIRIELNRLRDSFGISADEAASIEAEFIPKKKWFGLF